jgi:hypothetical protein
VSAVQHEVALPSYATKRHLDADNDGRRQASVQEAAEALFRPKEPLNDAVVPAAASTDQPARKPRVLAAALVPSNQHETAETPAGVAARSAAAATIPASHAARIRTWIKYGMTTAQVAAIDGAVVDEVKRVLQGT